MPPPRTGTIEPHGDHFDVRVRLPGGKLSPRVHLDPGLTREQARERAAKAQRMVDEGHASAAEGGETFDDWADRWFIEREARGLSSVDDDRGRFGKWISPKLGRRPIVAIQTEELESFVEYLDNTVREGVISAKTAANIWTLIPSAFDEAQRSKRLALRVRKDNPAAGVRGPDPAPKKAKTFLYPSEVLRLLACEKVPLKHRRAVAVAIYLYIRAAEQRPLGWPALDLDHAVALVHETEDRDGNKKTTKGKKARRLPIEPALLPLLRAMKDENAGPLVTPLLDESELSPSLRRWLLLAGVDRAELHVDPKDKTRKRMTWHDLRATGITWCAVRGDDPLRIMQRGGHEQFETTMGYVREADILREGFGEVFPPLPLAALGVPERPSGPSPPDGSRGQPAPPPARGRDGASTAVDTAGSFVPDRPIDRPDDAKNPSKHVTPAGVEPSQNAGFCDENGTSRTVEGESRSAGCAERSANPVAERSAPGGAAPRHGAIVDLAGVLARLAAAGDLAGARAVYDALGGLLESARAAEPARTSTPEDEPATPGDSSSGAKVASIATARARREGRR